ncbi:MAG: GspH/FimT family pseudopilin [Desulfobacterales bacterium]|nr:MAG: GspH/FimT family pseudopilin [Desulfobacterales bacterium]
MWKDAGFSILELVVTIAIFATLSAIALPNVISWRGNTTLRGAVNNLKGDLEYAKLSAVKENAWVVINLHENHYEIFVDDGAGGGAVDWIRSPGETLLRNRRLWSGVTIDLGATTLLNNRTRFNGRGLPDDSNLGSIVMAGTGGNRSITLNRIGRIRIQ